MPVESNILGLSRLGKGGVVAGIMSSPNQGWEKMSEFMSFFNEFSNSFQDLLKSVGSNLIKEFNPLFFIRPQAPGRNRKGEKNI